MGLDTHDNSELSVDTVNAIAEGNMNAGQGVAIKNLEDQIKKQIHAAGEFSQEDKDRWMAKVEQTDKTSTTELQAVARDIDKEKSVISQMITKYVGTINTNREFFGKDAGRKLDTAQQYIDEFKGLPLEEKTKWLELLSTEIDGLKGLYETAKDLAPDAMNKFNTLRRSEKKDFIEGLKNSRDGLKQLEEILGKNKAHLSPGEMEKIRVRMRDVPPQEQGKFLKELVETEIKPREELTQKFRLFPAEMRKAFADFDQLTRAERETAIDTLTKTLSKDYRGKLFDSALAKHFSEGSKEKAYTWFVQAPLDQRVLALQMIESQMKFEEKQSFLYEDALNQLPSTTDPATIAEMRRSFYESKYEDKVSKVADLKKQLAKLTVEAKEAGPLEAKYEGRLDKALEDQDISETTHERDMARFKKLKLEEKKKDLEAFDARLKPRRELKEKFQKEVSQDLQKEHGPDFYRRSHHGRMEKLESLLKLQKDQLGKPEAKEDGEDTADKKGLEKGKTVEQMVQSLTLEASTAEGKDDYEGALDAYDKILVLDPDNKFAAKRATEMEKILAENEKNGELVDMTDSDLEKLVREAKSAEKILQQRKILTINSVLGQATEQSDRKQNKQHAGDKKSHISGAFAEIQDQLVAEHDMMLDSDGNAVQIQTIKVNDLKTKTDSEIHTLGKDVAKIQTNQERREKTHNFQAHDGQKIINGEQWAEKAATQEEAIDDSVLSQIEKNLKKSGIRIDDLTARRLAKKVENTDQEVKLAA